MLEFHCGHQECGSRLTAVDQDALMRQVAEHLRAVHHVDSVTETLLSYLESTCVTAQSSYASGCRTLRPGDVITTGTPDGVGFTRQPARFLHAGDTVEVEIDQIGRIVTPIVPALDPQPAVTTAEGRRG